MPTENELFSAVDALLEEVAQDDLPPPEERKRLREAAGLSQEQIAKALKSRRETIGNWEAGVTEPRPPKRAAYARLLEGLAARFPAPATDAPATAPAPAIPEAFTGRPSPGTRAGSGARQRPAIASGDKQHQAVGSVVAASGCEESDEEAGHHGGRGRAVRERAAGRGRCR